MLNPADARVEWYPGMDSGRTPGTTAERPLEQCGSCRAAPSCVSAMRGFAPGPGNPLRPVDDVRPIEKCAAAMFVRRADLDRLLAEASRIDRCTAPWDSLEAHDRTGRAAPCEGSWPRRDVIGNPDGEGGGWLRDGLLRSFNAPSMVAMRRAMVAGGRAASCRPACPRFGESWRDRSPTRLPRTAVFHENLMLNLREFIDGADVLRSRPLSITISPSLKCNQACRMCDLADPSAGPLDVRVPDAILDEVAMLLPTTATLAITGGEPLTSRRIIDIIAGITPKTLPDTRVTLTTNGTLLRPETIARFERSNLASVYISLNAATAATHALVTGVDGAFAGVVENARAMVAASRKMPMKPDVSLSFVVMRSTIGELGQFIELARTIGAGVRLLPIERDRLGESIFTDPDVAANAAEKIRGLLFRLRGTWPDAAVELSRLDRLIRTRMADNDYSPM